MEVKLTTENYEHLKYGPLECVPATYIKVSIEY